jgi:DNA-binding IclR family transcriptional regulator
VRDQRGKAIAAIHVHGPAYRFPPPRAERRIAALVVAAAEATGRELALQLS